MRTFSIFSTDSKNKRPCDISDMTQCRFATFTCRHNDSQKSITQTWTAWFFTENKAQQ